MTRLILIALLGFGLAGLLGLDTADALGRFGHGKGTLGGGQAAGLATLELTDGRKEQLQSLHQQHRAKMQALKELGDISREDVRALRERHREAFMGVLTGEQHRQQMSALKASEEVGREQVRALRAQRPGWRVRRRWWRERRRTGDGNRPEFPTTGYSAAHPPPAPAA